MRNARGYAEKIKEVKGRDTVCVNDLGQLLPIVDFNNLALQLSRCEKAHEMHNCSGVCRGMHDVYPHNVLLIP